LRLGSQLHAHLARAATAELQKRVNAARVIAWAWEGYVIRKRFIRSRAAAKLLQQYARWELAYRKAIITLQRCWRGAIVRKVMLKQGILLGSCVKRCSYGPVVHCEVRAWLRGTWSLSASAVCSRSGGLQKQHLDLEPHRRTAAANGSVQPSELVRRWLQDLSVTWRQGRPVLYLPHRPPGGVLQHLPSRSLSRSQSVCSRDTSGHPSHSMSEERVQLLNEEVALFHGDLYTAARVVPGECLLSPSGMSDVDSPTPRRRTQCQWERPPSSILQLVQAETSSD